MNNDAITTAAANAVVDIVAKEFRATHFGFGGSAAIGYGVTADAARAHLAEVLAFNLAHNGRLVV